MAATKLSLSDQLKQCNSFLGILALVLFICSYLGEYHFILDLISNFKLQLAYGLISLSCISLLLKNFKLAIPLLLCSSFLTTQLLSWYQPHKENINIHEQLTLYYANVLTHNPHKEKLLQDIQQHNPDIIALVEVDAKWKKQLEKLKDYPHYKIIPRGDNFGIALYSKQPLDSISLSYFGTMRVPSIYATFTLNNKQLHFLLTHPVPPIGKNNATARNKALEETAQFISNTQGPFILAGDLNTTMWSPHYMKLERDSKLYNTRQGFGICPTWPSGMFTKIPIDHILVSPDIHTTHFEVLPSIGSDHLPILVKLTF